MNRVWHHRSSRQDSEDIPGVEIGTQRLIREVKLEVGSRAGPTEVDFEHSDWRIRRAFTDLHQGPFDGEWWAMNGLSLGGAVGINEIVHMTLGFRGFLFTAGFPSDNTVTG